jgi:putative transposase
MSRYIRSYVPGATYFFTVNLADRSSDLLVREIGKLRSAYADVQRRHPFHTLAICVLPEHLHALWRLPDDDADFALRWQQIKRHFSTQVDAPVTAGASLAAKREKGVWQRRYWEHQVRDETDFARHVDYIHYNPVKHGHVRQVKDWPHSSFHQWAARGDVPEAWGLVEAPDGRFGELAG